MVAGAFVGWFGAYIGLGLWGGVLLAFLVGMFLGLLHASMTVSLGLSQHVVGLGITLLATSLTYYAYRVALPEVTSPPKIEAFQPISVTILAYIPILGPALAEQTPLTYLAIATVLITAFVLYRDSTWSCSKGCWRKSIFCCSSGAICAWVTNGGGSYWIRSNGTGGRLFDSFGL